MKYFFDPSVGVRAFESDGSQDLLITGDMRPMSPEEVHQHLNPAPSAEQLAATARAAAQAYLTSTDWYVVRQFERGVPTPEAVAAERARCVEVLNE